MLDVGVQEIQTEIMTNGPVAAAIFVYTDFFHYKQGKKSKLHLKFKRLAPN